MDAGRADSLAASADPKALNALRNRGSDPAVARAVAGQFGSFLMQGMMRDADGNAMSMAGGTGGAAVSSMFASVMSRYAMSGDRLGLADTIYRSMTAKEGTKPDTPKTDSVSSTADTAPSAPRERPAAQGAGIPLGPYWQLGGHRPFGAPMAHFSAPAGQTASAASSGAATGTHRASLPPIAAAATTRKAPSPSAGTHDMPSGSSPASQAPALFPRPHVHLLGRELIWQPTEAETAHTSPAGAASQAFPWNILQFIERGLAGGASSSPTSVSGGSSDVTSNGTTFATSAPLHDAPTHGADAPAFSPAHSLDRPPHHADNGNSTFLQAEEFAGELSPKLNEAASRLGVSPRVLLAQAALETGWGHSVVGNNIFGIKAGGSWHGGVVSANTHEMQGGRLESRRATFRSYATVADAVDDYVTLVTSSHRYRAALGSGDNAEAYGQELAAGGYASDRDYATKLAAVANSPTMTYAVGAAEDAAADRRLLAHG